MTIGICYFVFKSATHCSFDSMNTLASLLLSSCGFASFASIDFASDSTSNSAITSMLVVVGPYFLLRDTSCIVILFFLYHNFKNFFCTLILIVPTDSIQGYPKTMSTSPISRASKSECNTYLSILSFKSLKSLKFSPATCVL
jgi:hypothetical protein